MRPKGQATTEMVLLLPLLCLILFGTLDLARYIKTVTELNNAAHVGVMTAQNVANASATPVTYGTVIAAVQTAFPHATVTVVPGGGAATPVPTAGTFEVDVSTNFHLVTPFVRTLNGTSRLVGTSVGTQLP